MAYTTVEGRQQILDVLVVAAGELDCALGLLGEAYEHLDEHAADAIESELFGPVRAAYGRTKRTYSEFADRCGLASQSFQPHAAVAPSNSAKGLIEAAIDEVAKADGALVELQDSMLPVEVGDVELRTGIAAIRELVGGLRRQAREIVRTLGR